LLPTVAVAVELSDGRLVELRPPGNLTPQHLWLAEPSARWRSPAVRAVHATLIETA
jgi:DNA-binding transcriptional LysR family regulator